MYNGVPIVVHGESHGPNMFLASKWLVARFDDCGTPISLYFYIGQHCRSLHIYKRGTALFPSKFLFATSRRKAACPTAKPLQSS